MFFASSVNEQHLLCSSTNCAMHKIEPGTHTTGAVKGKFKETIERFVARDNTV